jgi:hypothetical protein
MKLIIYLTFLFIAFEFSKLLMLKKYWNASMNRDKNTLLVIFELIYLVYLIALFFFHYWYIGTGVLLVSIVTAFQVMDDYMEKTKYNKQIRNYIATDGIVSIIVMSVLIIKELLK